MHPMSAILADGVRIVKEYIQDLVQLDQRQGEGVWVWSGW